MDDKNGNKKDENVNTEDALNRQPSTQGEQSISGSAPDPESDDDTLENAQNVGEQIDEDPEHPKELDLGGDIDKGEEEIRTQ